MTTLVSDKIHLFTGWRDILMDKPWAFHFLKKVTYGFLDEVKNCVITYMTIKKLVVTSATKMYHQKYNFISMILNK